jgi:hypothetical protein
VPLFEGTSKVWCQQDIRSMLTTVDLPMVVATEIPDAVALP